MSARIVSPDLAARARELLDAGASIRSAAARLGVSRQTLRRALEAFASALTPTAHGATA